MNGYSRDGKRGRQWEKLGVLGGFPSRVGLQKPMPTSIRRSAPGGLGEPHPDQLGLADTENTQGWT